MFVAGRGVPRLSTVNTAATRGDARGYPRSAADLRGLPRQTTAIRGSVRR